MTKAEVTATILDQRVIAIVRAAAAEDAHQAVTALLRAGLRAIEVSLVTPGALDVIREVAGAGHPGAHIGVGTVLRAHEVERGGARRRRICRVAHAGRRGGQRHHRPRSLEHPRGADTV